MLPNIPEKLYLSLGENCLPDIILSRHGIKSFSTIYSHGRSNIDYAIALEKESYQNLLNEDYLYYDFIGPVKVSRNRYYSTTSNIFSDLHQNGFEFTHHDVISEISVRNNFFQKIHKLNYYRGKSNTVFFYHYRARENKDIDAVFEKAEAFAKYYEVDGKTCEIIIFTQELVDQHQMKDVIRVDYSNRIHGYIFKTHHMWEGKNPNLFRAVIDDDLIKQMFSNFQIQKNRI